MQFTYNPAKSAANKVKHGIDFGEAQRLWEDDVLEIPSQYQGEPRALLIGHIEGKYWTAVVTRRDEAIRILSCRRSRTEEVSWYEKRKSY